jgi:hypothetical protein
MSLAGFSLETAMRRTWTDHERGGKLGLGYWRTFCPLLLAAVMRDVMRAMFSVSCFARWGLMCISSAMVVVSGEMSSMTRGDSVHRDVRATFCGAVSPAGLKHSARRRERNFWHIHLRKRHFCRTYPKRKVHVVDMHTQNSHLV